MLVLTTSSRLISSEGQCHYLEGGSVNPQFLISEGDTYLLQSKKLHLIIYIGFISLIQPMTIHLCPISCRLLQMLETHSVWTHAELVCVFLLLCRSLGWKSRLVCNLVTVPLKPRKEAMITLDTIQVIRF